LRHTGYKPKTAIADLIDNSIAANASEIGVRLSKNFDSTYTVWVGDNGCGMDEETLIKAMKYGSSRDLARNKLSVYGLGLKMASSSFSKRFSVVTREKGGSVYCATYDLDEMADHPWTFQVGKASEQQIIALDEVSKSGSGTVVIWESANFVVSEQSHKKKRVGSSKARNLDSEISSYLGLVFHRFMEPKNLSTPALSIKMNGNTISPFDPVHADYLDPEWTPIVDDFYLELEIDGKDERVPYKMITYKLNGKDDPENKPGALEASKMGMPTQGIYPYRENRILQDPSWLDVLAFHPDTNTMRVVLELDPRLDQVIRTDVKKSGIALPDEMWEDLKEQLELYKAEIKKRSKQKLAKREKDLIKKGGGDLHKPSNTVIDLAKQDIPNPNVKRISPTTVEIETLFGPQVTEAREYAGVESRNSRIQPVDDLEGGLLWEPSMRGSDQVILLNRSHPFYRKIYWQLRRTPLATQGLDFLLFSLANAEWMTRTDRAKEQFFQMRQMMANTLRTLVAELDDSPELDYGDDDFGADE
jgi:plasmid maintenance system antidote protein VapI